MIAITTTRTTPAPSDWPALQVGPQALSTVASPDVGSSGSHAHALGVLMAFMTLEKTRDNAADTCLAAFVTSRLRMAERQTDDANTTATAICLAETHEILLTIIHQTPRLNNWHQSALWHSRRTHCALLNHIQEYGCHPAIENAFRAGCLTLRIPSGHMH